ncbi:MAG: hypothetical protein JHC26_09705 [Thermofilum sp.]|uniref:hypothetical protein n=1 Tax=Thermofilum sp. TaxID=1961369 RepID=UPI0025829E07|nr:hypothetical protein [Thermofilum sp.]MCI4409356.1 hypothetical protein [Thermofilum sp.]
MSTKSRTRSKHVEHVETEDAYEKDIEKGRYLALDVMRVLSSFGLTEDKMEVYVSGIERIEDYDEWIYMTLNVVVPEFTGLMLEDIREVIHEHGFIEQSDFRVIPMGDKVLVEFYLRN